MHEKHQEWLERRGIDPTLAEKFGITTTRDGNGYWLTVPYLEHGQPVNRKYRMTAEKRHRMDEGAHLTLWNHDALLSPEVRAGADVIITEGEWDALAAIQAGFQFTLSVPNGAPATSADDPFAQRRYEFILRAQSLLDTVKTFILATDADEPGRALAADLARLLGPERCKFIEYPTGCKDLGDILAQYDEQALVQTIAKAKPYPIKGLYKFDDFPEPPTVQSLAVGIEGLDDMFPLVPGSFSIITGYAGQGKTSLLLSMLANLLRQGVPMAVASFETSAKPILLRRMRAAIYEIQENSPRCYSNGPADDLLREKFSIIAQMSDDDDSDMTLEYLLDLAKTAVLRDGIRLLVIDPWNEIEHKRRGDETETDYTGRSIRALKRFARLYECAVWLVAHPRKPQTDGRPKMPSLYDLAGSANFANKADYGMIVHRPDMVSNNIDVRVAKVRMGLPGQMATKTLEWLPGTSSYRLWA
jgi:twinkle protein